MSSPFEIESENRLTKKGVINKERENIGIAAKTWQI